MLWPQRGLWHNTFSQTVGSGTDTEARLKAALAAAGSRVMGVANMAVQGIGEGHPLRLAAATLGIPVNRGFARGSVVAHDMPAAVTFGNLTLRIVGPTQSNLDELGAEWGEWLDKHEDNIASGDPLLLANADRSVPNLCSITVFVGGDDKTMLFTGDGRSDHLLQGLKLADLLDTRGNLWEDVLKLPHHGSNRNITKTFFTKVRASQYVITANGRDDNPNLATLIWLVETANRQHREVEILLTNETLSTKKLQEEYDPVTSACQPTLMEKGADSMVHELAAQVKVLRNTAPAAGARHWRRTSPPTGP